MRLSALLISVQMLVILNPVDSSNSCHWVAVRSWEATRHIIEMSVQVDSQDAPRVRNHDFVDQQFAESTLHRGSKIFQDLTALLIWPVMEDGMHEIRTSTYEAL